MAGSRPPEKLSRAAALGLARAMRVSERPFDLDAPGYLYEIKFDGWRLLACAEPGEVTLLTKTGANATAWFPELTRSLSTIPGGPHVLDGEVCVLDDLGRSDFDRLHARALRRRWYAGADPVVYCVFDLLVEDGLDITGLPLVERKARLARLLAPKRESLLLVGHFDEGGRHLFDQAVLQLELEGLVAKRLTSTYQPGVRSTDWVKVKRKGAVPAQRFSRKPRGSGQP